MSEPINTETPEYKDQEIRCSDCPNTFIWTADEQKYYKDRGLFQPKRCHSCRLRRRQAANQNINITSGREEFSNENKGRFDR